MTPAADACAGPAPAWKSFELMIGSTAAEPSGYAFILHFGRIRGCAAGQRVSISGIPLTFETNLGRAPAEVQYLAHGPSNAIELSAHGATLAFAGEASASTRIMRLLVQRANRGSRPAADAPLRGQVNYFIGNDPSKWLTDVATYGKVHYPGVYPGIDLVYYGTQGRREYDFDVAPGVNPRDIRMNFNGGGRVPADLQSVRGQWQHGCRMCVRVHRQAEPGRYGIAGEHPLRTSRLPWVPCTEAPRQPARAGMMSPTGAGSDG